jgi:hypothetical protein
LMLTDQQIRAKYGQPGDAKNFTTCHLPFPMRIAWDTKTTVNKITCHKLIEKPLYNALLEIHLHYGLPNIQKLGIDLFGGCFNFRKKRGSSTKWSTHSWAIAVDLHPSGNQLKWKKDKALFAKPEYKPMMDIFYKHGFVNQGVELGFDYMHFEIGA